MSEEQVKNKYVCSTVEDALQMLDAVEKFIDNYQRLKDKYVRVTRKMERIFGSRPRREPLGYTGRFTMDKALKQMFEQIVYDVLTRQGIIGKHEEREEPEEEEIEKFFEEEQEKEEEKDSKE